MLDAFFAVIQFFFLVSMTLCILCVFLLVVMSVIDLIFN